MGIFAIGQKPAGVKDPFKLRRHALAVARLLIEIPAPLNLTTLLQEAAKHYGDSLPIDEAVLESLKLFILERLQSLYQGQGVSADLVHAVRAREEDCLYDFDKRIQALQAFTHLPEASVLAAACKRVNNLLKHADAHALEGDISPTHLEHPAEQSLYEHLQRVEQASANAWLTADYTHILTQSAGLRPVVDEFFEQVMVMVDDTALRLNRLRILARLQALLQGVAAISLLTLNTASTT